MNRDGLNLAMGLVIGTSFVYIVQAQGLLTGVLVDLILLIAAASVNGMAKKRQERLFLQHVRGLTDLVAQARQEGNDRSHVN